MEKKTMGSFLAILRKAKGMTQKELAQLLNVSDKAVSRWERDESMPDITLIPILADIFGVTCDELLRGERAGKAHFAETAEKKGHRMKLLLKKNLNRFYAFSMISVGAAALGMLLAFVTNFIFHQAILGFCYGVGGIIAAVVVQICLYFMFKCEVDTEELESLYFAEYEKKLRDLTLKIFYMAVILFAFYLPLVLFGRISYSDYIAGMAETMEPAGYEFSMDTQIGAMLGAGKISVGLLPGTWFLYGGLSSIIAALLCFICDRRIKISDCRNGRFGVTEEELAKSRKAMLRTVKYLVVLMVTLGLTTGAARVFQEKMPERVVEGTTFETFAEFKDHMETIPRDMYKGVVEVRQQLDKYHKVIYGENGEVLCDYRVFNDSVVDVKFGKNNKLPITTYTEEDFALAEQKVEEMMWLWSVAGVLECAVVAGIYLKKRKVSIDA